MDTHSTITPPAFNDVVPPKMVNSKNTYTHIQEQPTLAHDAQQWILNNVFPSVFGVSLLISMILMVGILYAILRVRQIREMEALKYKSQPMTAQAKRTFKIEDAPTEGALGEVRWQEVIRHSSSDNPNDWRQAILEADIMLDDLMSRKGYMGESLGEKLKQANRGDIHTIDNAWEAHKIRNRIAHDGSDFNLDERETRRAIHLYRSVFEELGYIE